MILEAVILGGSACFVASLRFARWALEWDQRQRAEGTPDNKVKKPIRWLGGNGWNRPWDWLQCPQCESRQQAFGPIGRVGKCCECEAYGVPHFHFDCDQCHYRAAMLPHRSKAS